MEADNAEGGNTVNAPEHDKTCNICTLDSASLGICHACSSSICSFCAGYCHGLFEAALRSSGNAQPPSELKCLKCQPVQEHDTTLVGCLEMVAGAVVESLSQNNDAEAQRVLGHHVAVTLDCAGQSGLNLPDSFVAAAVQMFEYEVRRNVESKDMLPSVLPWNGNGFGLPPELSLKISSAFARKLDLRPPGRLRILKGSRFVIAVVSDKLVDYSTAHLVIPLLMAMSMHEHATVWVLCVAEPERVASMNPLNPYRRALKELVGLRFLEIGAMSDAEIADRLGSVKPHAILLDCCPDRLKFLDGAPDSLVATVPHAGTTGLTRVDFILGSDTTLPEDNMHHFTEKRQLLKAPFLWNSFRQFYPHHADRLHTLRTDTNARSEERTNKFGLPPDCHILTNISFPEGLKPRFWATVLKVLRDNATAVLVLVDRKGAFKLRKQALFKSEGLERRLFFVPESMLHNEGLHGLLAVSDVYVDGIGSTTELHDALWASRVVISFQGDSLAERIGADVLTAFGTPENLCKTDKDAVDRINGLLQSSNSYAEACLKSEHCRTQSSMYDIELRGRQVIDALKEAYNIKLLEQKKHENDGAGSTLLSGSDNEQAIIEQLSALHIEPKGPINRGEASMEMPAEFRGVPVDVVWSAPPWDDFRYNAAVREAMMRDFITMEFGRHAWTRGVPMNECDVTKGGDTKLDLISLTVRGQVLHAILLEQPTSTAAILFEELAHDWQASKVSPPPGLLDRTIIALRALLQLLACVHGRKRSFGGDPLKHLHLSPLKDGHFKNAAAHVLRSNGSMSAMMLGRATHMLDLTSIGSHRPGCIHCKSATPVIVDSQPGARSRPAAAPVRVSGRNASKSASFSHAEVLARLSSVLPRTTSAKFGDGGKFRCCAGFGSMESAQRDDLRRAAQAIMNAVVGHSEGPTVVERIGASGEGWEDQCTGAELYTIFLRDLDDLDFQSATGIKDRSDPNLFTMLQGKNRKFARLLDLLAKMFGSTQLEARRLLSDEKLLHEVDVPSNELPTGLESAPADRRKRLMTCEPLMKEICGKVQHYFVKGDKSYKWGRDHKVLIDVWLCYTLNPEKENRVFRSVRAAEPGKAGDLAAIYGPPGARLVRVPDNPNYVDITLQLGLPILRGHPYIEGKDRRVDDAPRRVEISGVGMYLNSSKDATNVNAKPANCGRLWDPEWKKFGPSNAPSFVPDDVRMGLVLLVDVKMYEELLYAYDWAKSEVKSGRSTRTDKTLQVLSRSGGGM